LNIKEYISSGIVESYVLGLASQEERSEFEQLCAQYPELVAARTDFELALEKQAMENAIAPPSHLRDTIMLNIHQDIPAGKSKVITMQTSDTPRKSGMLRFVAAASVILLLGAAYFAYNFYSKNKKLNDTVKTNKGEIDSMRAEIDGLKDMLTRPTVNVVDLKPTSEVKASANVYWDSTNADVYMVIKNLPKLPNDKQYQLWSIINGADGQLQPSSMGLFDVGDDQKIILKMPAVKKADAFAITVEERGNKGGPNLQELKAMGKTGL
jgi:anti-sigma-K factor RskA